MRHLLSWQRSISLMRKKARCVMCVYKPHGHWISHAVSSTTEKDWMHSFIRARPVPKNEDSKTRWGLPVLLVLRGGRCVASLDKGRAVLPLLCVLFHSAAANYWPWVIVSLTSKGRREGRAVIWVIYFQLIQARSCSWSTFSPLVSLA